MKIATWNVNSLNVRLPQVVDWLTTHRPAILGLQELKQVNEAVNTAAIEALGYRLILNGQKTYNGVALIYDAALAEPEDIVYEIPGLQDEQRRVVAATFGDLRLINAYVVNGESLTSEKFEYKLRWLAAFHAWLAAELIRYPKLIVMGDFNIAPTDEDVYDPLKFQGQVLCSAPERAFFQEFLALGFVDTLQKYKPEPHCFTWWDYRGGGFRRNHGLRIDHLLASHAVMPSVVDCGVDAVPRGWERPSDHTPVMLTLQIA
ncbi:MAG: exodeoxyribonuclease III [Halothiobacillus sp. 24-54-40]|jgi:exodeoxyribonuclease-3|nr:MAG: exodeoxyribonuclease III [Halothiobacillus sp. 35-54-62]OYZ85625.1 MAG: exodeoxyribonuclease III [Halothiobacillus sp. 24-54-40]OZA79396.1 MAG: exodeoxyribonuclease III [Halothiobacillus sp. 39-53-45]HQS03327.1 exodeoxyribonuclease III [Halothiobacillus sp.]HQS28530.1 exodeoxyribonuclease III [Halothiobacillus sp.]